MHEEGVEMKVAFLGLGMMGAPMARRLIDAGHEVHVWNRTPEKAEPFAGDATVATKPEGAVEGAEVVFTMLATPDAVGSVMTGEDGAFGGMGEETTWIEMSTIGPQPIYELSTHLPPGVDMMDAPVLGSTPQAESGELKIFVGGSEEQFAEHKGLLETFGVPRHVGKLGQGAAMKLVANSVLGTLISALGEALSLGEAMDLDDETMLEVLGESPIGPTVKSKKDKIVSGSYEANFKLELAHKDLGLVCTAAEELNVDLKLGRSARAWFETAEKQGLGDQDYSAVIATILKRNAETP